MEKTTVNFAILWNWDKRSMITHGWSIGSHRKARKLGDRRTLEPQRVGSGCLARQWRRAICFCLTYQKHGVLTILLHTGVQHGPVTKEAAERDDHSAFIYFHLFSFFFFLRS